MIMSFSLNIHPNQNWTEVKAELFGQNEGCCIHITMRDDKEELFQPSLHFGSMKYANEFIGMLKKAVNGLPEYCESCGRKKE
jgi:hypothetical protein